MSDRPHGYVKPVPNINYTVRDDDECAYMLVYIYIYILWLLQHIEVRVFKSFVLGIHSVVNIRRIVYMCGDAITVGPHSQTGFEVNETKSRRATNIANE